MTPDFFNASKILLPNHSPDVYLSSSLQKPRTVVIRHRCQGLRPTPVVKPRSGTTVVVNKLKTNDGIMIISGKNSKFIVIQNNPHVADRNAKHLQEQQQQQHLFLPGQIQYHYSNDDNIPIHVLSCTDRYSDGLKRMMTGQDSI